MYLIYFDESGNSGNNLIHSQQPVFGLACLLIDDAQWMEVESGIEAIIETFFPAPRPESFEIHANELINPRGYFRQFPITHRIEFLTEILQFLHNRKIAVFQRTIVKSRYAKWLEDTFGGGVIINPHLAAFPLLAQVVNDYLKSLPEQPRGIFISDENRDIMFDVEKSQKMLRGASGRLHLSQIIEKGFFIDSRKSYPLQLADICAYFSRRCEEAARGFPIREFEQPLIDYFPKLLHYGQEAMPDVLAWLESEQKRSDQGQKPRGR